MSVWLEMMSPFQRVFAYIALAGSFALVIQFVMLLIGIGHVGDADGPDTSGLHAGHDAGCDYDAHDDLNIHDIPDHDHDPLRPFTLRGIIAFTAIFGWVGLILLKMAAPAVIAVMLAVGAGMTAMVLMAIAFRWMFSLQQSGNLDLRNALGVEGSVYMTIPPVRSGIGKVSMLVQERFVEIDAVTDDPESIVTGRYAVVVDVEGDTVVVKARGLGAE